METLLHPQKEVTLEESPLTDFESYVKDMAGQQKSWADMSIDELSNDDAFKQLLDPANDPTLNTLHINPGAAGISGFHKVRTLIRFTIDNGAFSDLEIIELA